MRALPEGQYYVLVGGRECIDHRGNVYAVSPPAAESVPARVASPKRKRPPSPLPERTQQYVDAYVMELVKQPTEHFITLGLSESGVVVFEDQQSGGHWNHCDVDMKRILTQLERTGTAGLIAIHNHPDGSREMSDEDRDLTERLKTALSAYDVALIKHQIVPGDPELMRVTEAQRPHTSWDAAEAKQAKLWAPYGGCPPWQHAAR
jgi:DNA repair protein RadC